MAEHPSEDLLLDLALGHADTSDRERAGAHLAWCLVCRRDYDELAGAIELVLPVVPRVAPPPGFEWRVLERLDAARGTPSPDAAGRPGVRRRTVLWAAAAAVAGVVAGAGGTAYLRRAEDPAPSWAAPLLTADGTRVGQVSPSFGGDGPVLVVDVTDGPAGRTYTCRLRLADGAAEDVATWGLADDRPNSWVVDVPTGDEVTAVELVAEGGHVWAAARL